MGARASRAASGALAKHSFRSARDRCSQGGSPD